MQLYMFEHCSLCFRVRMTAALKGVPLDETVVLDDDTETMVGLVGRRVIPILVKDDGTPMLESLDMVDLIEARGEPIFTGPERPEISALAQALLGKTPVLTMPRYPRLGLPEFATPAALAHYMARKQETFGDFDALMAKTPEQISAVIPVLEAIDAEVRSPSAINGELSKDDVRMLPLLRSAAIIADLTMPPRVRDYFETLMDLTGYEPLPRI